MKTIGFIGVYDKTDFMLYVAKVLTTLGKKVLIIDSTLTEKARYVVPVINPTKSYVTEFEKIDVAVGFKDYDDIKNYLGISEEKELEYDVVLLDIDSRWKLEQFKIEECVKKYFVTSFDLYSLKKGLEIFAKINEPINLTKILFSKDIIKEEDEYLNFVSLDYKIAWNEDRIYFPIDNGDQSIIIENQRVSKIKIRRLSTHYKESLMYIVEDIVGDEISSGDIKKAFRAIEKEA